MKTDHQSPELHFFVCTNARENGQDCATKGGQEVLEKLKKWSKSDECKARYSGKVRINKAGCLGRCEEGVVCVAYPHGDWMVEVTANDVDAIKEKLLSK